MKGIFAGQLPNGVCTEPVEEIGTTRPLVWIRVLTGLDGGSSSTAGGEGWSMNPHAIHSSHVVMAQDWRAWSLTRLVSSLTWLNTARRSARS